MGVGFDPLDGPLVNDPDTGTTRTVKRETVVGYVSIQPHALDDLKSIKPNRVFFSNDNFGTGQANAQAPAGGDAGDIFGSPLDGTYERIWEYGHANDYDGGTVTNGSPFPFDIDAMDVILTQQNMLSLSYSKDDGDPNPHNWIPGVSEGQASGISYNKRELYFKTTPETAGWFTSGGRYGVLRAGFTTEDSLGLNRAEDSLPGGPLDDDVDAVDLEFGPFSYSVDFVDTRVFPDYANLAPGGTLRTDSNGNAFWYELPGLDPTDIYGVFEIDGESVIGLSENTDIDAIQFFTTKPDGPELLLLFSIDDDAPEKEDAWGNELFGNIIYVSAIPAGRKTA